MQHDRVRRGDLAHPLDRRVRRDPLAVDLRFDPVARERIPEASRIRRPHTRGPDRLGAQLGDVLVRDEPAAVDDHDLVRHLLDLRQDVAGDENRLTVRGKRAEEVAQPANSLRVEPVRGLVEHQQLRIAEQRARDAQPLPHPERVAAHAPPRGIRDPDELEQLVGARPRQSRSGAQHAQMAASGPLRMVVRRFENRADTPDRIHELAVSLAVDGRAACGRPHETEQDAQRRRLPGAVGPEETGDAAVCDAERETVDRGRLPIALAEVGDLDHAAILGKPIDDPRRLRNVRDLELARHDRPITEQPAEQALLDLHGANAREPHRRRTPPQGAVHDEQLFRRQHDERPLPTPDCAHDDRRRDSEQHRSDDRRGPPDEDGEDTRTRQSERAQERSDEHDSRARRLSCRSCRSSM